MKKKLNFLNVVILFLVIINPIFAEKIEIVTTIPVETKLETFGTRQAAKVWVEIMNEAKTSIDIAQFYLSNKEGELLEPVIKAILNASKRGVKVRLLIGMAVNAEMKKNTDDALALFKNKSNISITMFDWKKLNGSIIHAKYFIIDKEKIFVGSQNFDWRALKHIHESGLLIKDKNMALSLSSVFDADWKYSNGDLDIYNKIKKDRPLIVSKNMELLASPAKYNPPGIKSALKVLVKLIRDSKKKIHIQLLNYKETIYKNEKDFMIITNALISAAKRGVKVKMLVSNWRNEKGNQTLLNLNKAENINVKIVTIPESKEGFIPFARVIHSKTMRIDDVSWVGTSNWGWDYFFKSRNIEIIVKDPKIAEIIDKLYEQLWDSSYAEIMDPQKKYIAPKRY